MIPIITAFAGSPDRGRGLARDMPVRWALEEVGQPYETRLVSLSGTKTPAHRSLHPFGQIPTYEEGDLVLFESGAIVFHIAQSRSGLLPEQPVERARAIAWMFAALSTVEPVILNREMSGYSESDKPWHSERQTLLEGPIRRRLDEVANWLGDSAWLEGDFSVGDLVMVQVLRRLGSSKLLAEQPSLEAYVSRAEGRPAFKRAFSAQLAAFEESSGR